MPSPDYHGHSIVNLMASLTAAQGGQCTDYPPLDLLQADTISRHDRVMLLVIDGLGDNTLQGLSPHGFLARHHLGRITSVCPTTTASAITSFLSGKGPLQHGLTGWFTWLRELGTVTAVLPFRSRYGGPPLHEQGLELGPLLGWQPLFDAFDRPVSTLQPHEISHSHFSQCGLGQARQLGYSDLGHCLQLAAEQLQQERVFVYGYWSELDRLAHLHGIHSVQITEHLALLERELEAFARQLSPDTLLLITADHGLVDTDPQHTIRLEQHPELQDCLNLPLCGEPRLAFCYVAANRAEAFEAYVTEQLAHACDLLSREQMLERKLFGLGRAHAEFGHRIGDYALVMKENYVIKDQVMGERPFSQIGVHGGLSEDELYVPLIVIKGGD